VRSVLNVLTLNDLSEVLLSTLNLKLSTKKQP